MKLKRKKILVTGIFFCISIVLLGVCALAYKPILIHSQQLNIVLSPHYDDAVLSLGGFIAQNKNNTIVATFFTQNASTTSETRWDKISGFDSSSESFAKRSAENSRALNILGVQKLDYSFVDFQYRVTDQSVTLLKDLTQAITLLIQQNKSFEFNIYGPAFFGDIVTHPDHKLLHQAFMDVAKIYANDPKVSFFMYEDFPYIQSFNHQKGNDLKSFVEKNDRVILTPVPLNLSVSDVSLKEQALSEYTSQINAFNFLHEDISGEINAFTSTRCPKTACEMVYKIDF